MQRGRCIVPGIFLNISPKHRNLQSEDERPFTLIIIRNKSWGGMVKFGRFDENFRLVTLKICIILLMNQIEVDFSFSSRFNDNQR